MNGQELKTNLTTKGAFPPPLTTIMTAAKGSRRHKGSHFSESRKSRITISVLDWPACHALRSRIARQSSGRRRVSVLRSPSRALRPEPCLYPPLLIVLVLHIPGAEGVFQNLLVRLGVHIWTLLVKYLFGLVEVAPEADEIHAVKVAV